MFTLPEKPLLRGIKVYERAARLARLRPLVTADQLAHRIGTFGYVNDARARAELGYATRPLEETLEDLARWAVQEGLL